MAVASKLILIGIIALSFVVGIFTFYILSDLSKEQKKKQIEELISQIVNFVIFIWVGKIVLNFTTFIQDPLSILAYPSNSHSFYLAVLFIAIFLFYKVKRKQLDIHSLIVAFLPVFLVASFFYEFIQFTWSENSLAFGYLVVLFILSTSYYLLRGHVRENVMILAMLTGWSVGVLGLMNIQPYVTVFGYMMAPWFIGVFFVISLLLLMFNQRKRGS